MTKRRPAVIRDRNTELLLGALFFVAGAWMIRDAYEGRGRKRPFAAQLVLP